MKFMPVIIAAYAVIMASSYTASAQHVTQTEIVHVTQSSVKVYESPDLKSQFRELPKQYFESLGHLMVIEVLSNGWVAFVDPETNESAYLHPLAIRLKGSGRPVKCDHVLNDSISLAGRGISSFNCANN